MLLIFNIILNIFKKNVTENIFLIQLIIGLLCIKYWLLANIVIRGTLPPSPVPFVVHMFFKYSLVAGLVFIINYFTMIFKTRNIKFNCFKLIKIILINIIFIFTSLFIYGVYLLPLYILAIFVYILWLKKGLIEKNKKISTICFLIYLAFIFVPIYIGL